MVKIKTRFSKLAQPNLPNPTEVAKEFGTSKLVKLNYNESVYGVTPKLKNFTFDMSNAHVYPDFKSPELVAELSKKYDLPEDYFYIANGSDSILDALPEIFTSIHEHHEALVPKLTYGRVRQTCIVKNIKMVDIEVDKNGYINLNQILDKTTKYTAIIYLVNPNMPTGTFYNYEEIADFIRKIPSNILIVLDEAYSEFATSVKESREIDKKLIEEFDNLLITHTFSKLYGLAAFRIGMGIARPYILDVFRKAYQYLPVSTFSSQAVKIAISDDEYYESIVKKVKKEVAYLEQEFESMKVKYIPSRGNFIMIKWPGSSQLAELRKHVIIKTNLIIRIVKDIGFRISVGTHEQNKKIVEAFKNFIADHNG